ncbi:MAG: rubredoxin [Planctomycetota bacterium]
MTHRHDRDKTTPPRWQCTICGWVYDPSRGDPIGGVPAGVPFDELPDGWTCPMCYAPKDKFVRID